MIHTRAPPAGALVAVVSRSHLDSATEAYLARLNPAERIGCGSALKFCRIAEGSADLYPRLAPTFEWDVAAGHAVLAAAGGAVTTPDGCTAFLWTIWLSHSRLHRLRRSRRDRSRPDHCTNVRSHVGPLPIGHRNELLRRGRERIARLGIVEQIKSLADDQPHFRMTGHRDAARDAHRVVTAEYRHVDFGMVDECFAISLIAESPGRPGKARFEYRHGRSSPWNW